MTELAPGLLDTASGALPYVRCTTDGPQLLIIQPLFEERNRLRRLLTAVMRGLAGKGIGSWMFDLPATGESAMPSDHARWGAWQDGVRSAAEHIATTGGQDVHILSIRGGSLLDTAPARSLYRLAPVSGERVLRELLRARVAGGAGETMAALKARIAAGEMLDLAGYQVPAALAHALEAATPPDPTVPVRTATVGDGAADVRFDGPRLWRQAEPEANWPLAEAIAFDLAEWIARCAR